MTRFTLIEPARPIPWIGPNRIHAPGVPFEQLPPIDAVLISHNHYDHLDLRTLKRLNKKFNPIFIVPLGNKKLLESQGISKVIALDWWQKKQIKQATITLLPAYHGSQRGLFDYNRALWGSYGVKIGDKKIYFAGDSGYNNHFKQIRQRWGTPDFSLLPIGAYAPRSLLKPYHMNPYEALLSHKDLYSPHSMAIHWGTFQLGAEPLEEPIKHLALARETLGVHKDEFFVVTPGQSVTLE